jgi:hypothetical protein
MPVEVPLEIEHIRTKLRADYTGRIPEATAGTLEERDANFLTRAVAAFSIHKLSPCSIAESSGAVVDGGGDGGIDAIFYNAQTHILWVIQSKFHRDGQGEPDLGGVTKFKEGLENLLRGNLSVFQGNQAFAGLTPVLETAFSDPLLKVRAVLVYTGLHPVSQDRRWVFENLKFHFSQGIDYFDVQFCNLDTVHGWIRRLSSGVAELSFTLLKPGWVSEPYETVYGLLPLAELAAIYRTYGDSLITANIRGYRGDTEVNEDILETVTNEPDHFFYLNNGLTAYCERLEVNNVDRANAEKKRVKAFGISVVNGAQTMGAIAKYDFDPSVPRPGHVFVKIISLAACTDDDFSKRITRSTNFQNQIGARDFVSLDEQQELIASTLELSGIHYHYKDTDDTPPEDSTNFTLVEATLASASLAQETDCDLCARLIANRKSLWSFDEVYPPTDAYRSRYLHVFRPDRSARTVWRAVQAKRAVVAALQNTETGPRKIFYANCRWLILNVIFLRLHPERGESIQLSAEELTSLTTSTQEYAEQLWNVSQSKGFVSAIASGWQTTKHFRSVFSSPSDCAILRSGLLSALAAVHT